MNVSYLLLTIVQLLLTAGVGGVFIVNYATRGIFLKEEKPQSGSPRFASDYHELMWLAERQRQHLDVEETQRFYHLRRDWAEMHSLMSLAP